MKKIFAYLTLFSLLFTRIDLIAQEESCVPKEADVFYSDIDDELFNRGKFVGKETEDYLRAFRRERNKNWAIAIGTTAIGIAALVFVSNGHEKKEEKK